MYYIRETRGEGVDTLFVLFLGDVNEEHLWFNLLRTFWNSFHVSRILQKVFTNNYDDDSE